MEKMSEKKLWFLPEAVFFSFHRNTIICGDQMPWSRWWWAVVVTASNSVVVVGAHWVQQEVIATLDLGGVSGTEPLVDVLFLTDNEWCQGREEAIDDEGVLFLLVCQVHEEV